MTNALITELDQAINIRQAVVMAIVVDSEQSVPRRPGSKMLVYPDGRISGSIGGGEMESRVIEAAIDTFDTGRPRRISFSLVDPGEGDPGVCGGSVELYLEPHLPRTTLFIVGETDVGADIAELADWLGLAAMTTPTCEPDDERIDGYTVAVVVADDPELLVRMIPRLLATPTPYVVFAGRLRTWETARGQLLAGDLTEAELDRVSVTAESPSHSRRQLALAILADVIAHERSP